MLLETPLVRQEPLERLKLFIACVLARNKTIKIFNIYIYILKRVNWLDLVWGLRVRKASFSVQTGVIWMRVL